MEEIVNCSSSEEISESFDAKTYVLRTQQNKLTLDLARDDFKNNKNCCDVTLHVNQENGDTKVIQAHSVILSAYSKYFQAAFSPLFNEGKSKSVTLASTWNYGDVLTVMDLIYGNSFELNEENVFDIYYLADYLMVEHVISTCLEFIKTHLNVQQALELWKVAKRAGHTPLIKIAKEFSLRNFSKLTKNKASGLYDLNSKQLLSIIRQDDLKIRNEKSILDCIYEWALHGQPQINPSVARFMDPNLCKLIFQGVRLGKLSRHPICNCCNFTKRRSEALCQCHNIGEICTRHEPTFEDYPYIAAHVKVCKSCTDHLDLLKKQQIYQQFPDCIHDYATKDESVATAWYKSRTNYETIVAIGGWNDNAPTSTVQVYNTQEDRWRKLSGDEAYPRAYHGLVELNGILYCVGGFNGQERLNTLLCLDNRTLQWTEKSPMHEKRCYVSVVSLNNFIYAIGGHDGQTRLRSVERYDSTTNQWSRMPNMNLVRSDACATTKDGKIFVIGGFDGDTVHNAVEVFDPEEQTWSFIASLATPRSGVRAISCKGKLCVIGGFNGDHRLKTIEILNEETNQWDIQPGQMSVARSNFGIEVFAKYVAVFGGYDDERRQTTAKCEVFCFNEGLWFPIANMPINSGCSALAVVTLKKVNAHREFMEKPLASIAASVAGSTFSTDLERGRQ